MSATHYKMVDGVCKNVGRHTMFSACRNYRYVLWREWDMHNPAYLNVIGLNPSTADETKDDPTIRKCIGFAKRHGFGALCMTNLFSFMATDPKVMKQAFSPIGGQNDEWLLSCGLTAGHILAAWGTHGAHLNRAAEVARMFPRALCLGKNADGSPKHPLYVPYDTDLMPLTPA